MGNANQGLSRRHFMGGMGVGGLALAAAGSTAPAAAAAPDCGTPHKTALGDAYYILNARLESGFEMEGQDVTGTKTELKTLRIENGKIAEISAAGGKPAGNLPAYDAGGMLMLPTFRDMHIHLDKTYYGGPWKAVRPNPNGVADRIKEEQVILPKLLDVAEERTGKMIDLMFSKGTTVTRSHCNIEPVSGLKLLEHLRNSFARRKDLLTSAIITFPQHGLLRANCEGLMRDACKMGVDYVGAVDPQTLDGNRDKSLDITFQIALDYKKPLDMHIHEPRDIGIATIKSIMDRTEKAKLQGQVTISHAYSLASLSPEEAKEMFLRMAQLGISISTSVPIGKGVMPLNLMRQCGVDVMVGTDSVIDWWSPFGDCDMLRKSNLAAQLYGPATELNLSRALGYATGWILPLSDKGEQLWPKPGVEASVNFVHASCSAEAVARVPDRVAVLHKGKLVTGGLKKA